MGKRLCPWCGAEVWVSACVCGSVFVQHKGSTSAYLFQGKSFFFFLIVFFPFPQLSQILSGFYFVSGKEKGGQIRWKGLNNFPLFFFFPMCIFPLKFLQSSSKVHVVFNGAWDPLFPAALITTKISWSHLFSVVPIHQQLFCYEKRAENDIIELLFSVLASKTVT